MKWKKKVMKSNKLEKIKKVKRIILFTLALALTNCQHEENAVEQSQSSIQTVSINEAKAFLLTSQNNPAGKLSSNQIAGLDLEKITQEKLGNTDQLLTVIPFKRTNAVRFDRILLLKVNNVVRSVVYKMYADGSQITSSFSGKILISDLDGNFINGFHLENGIATLQYIKKSSKSITNKSSSDEYGGDLEGVTVYNRYKNNRFIPEIADFGWGDNLSSGGGGGEVTWEQDPGAGDTGGSTDNSSEDVPPSCESFNFTSKKGANWQESAVKNITLRIVVLTQDRVEVTNTMIFPQAVLFGMPINFNKGNGDVTAGAAATVSAMALNETMKEMTKLYTRTLTNELTLRTKFQELLIKNYRFYTNGGTVNFNSTSTLPATNYKTNPRQTGLCDN
ncbi:hypothetical protein [Flavobacterium sp. ABG]|uniref:hypothetical protein n=1 Tax=Flavobacterium sp. ABG TaxID=1423322 RepID=UPI000649AD34|nr:hypothetical protein [Flavobacterium sp. ABG]KLT67921.1 hypothetical protein AB674_20030 [Flavobacterium sp. ABG]